MTGSGALRCICCQFIRNLQLSKRKSLLLATRPADQLLTLATYRYLHTSRLLQKVTKSTGDDDPTSSSSDSSSSDSDSSDSDDERSTEGLRDGSKRIDPRRSDDGAAVLRGKKQTINVGQDLSDEDDDVKIDPKLVSAAKEVAESLEGDSDKTETALLSQLLTAFKTANYQQRANPPKQTRKVYSQMLDDDENTESVLFSKKRSNQSKKSNERSVRGSNNYLDLFNGKRLGIFDVKSVSKPTTESSDLFDIVAEEERGALQNYPPQNAWEEQIQWTKEGKLWTFPIDNEAGWSEEKNVSFQQHVFLHNHLTDFPRYGPLRHFMELVTLSLSKNPYLTIQQKQEHIQWFRDYFTEKEAVLVTKLGDEGVIEKSSANKINTPKK